jgi:poly [ADP-ribose] polymerase
MAHKIEPAPTGRAACRGCKETIAKGVLRFCEEFTNPYSTEAGPSYRYWHLACAATKLANELGRVLPTYEGEIEGRASIEALIGENLRPEIPYAERAPSGRARCRACDVGIKKDELRVVFERTFEGPMGPQKGHVYAHPACVGRFLERERSRERPPDAERDGHTPELASVRDAVAKNSRLSPEDLASVLSPMA